MELPVAESTQAVAEQLLATQPAEGTVVLAHDQTQGRGQSGNTWHSEPGKNLTFSLLLRPRFLSVRQLFHLNRWASLAVADTLAHWLPADRISVKWPNDVLIGARKVCGMIFNNQVEGAFLRSSIVGIGLNVNQHSFGEEAPRATSLAIELGEEVPLTPVRNQLFEHLEHGYLALKAGNTNALEAHYLQRMHGYQERMRFRIGGEQVEAVIAGVDANGRLVLEQEGRLQPYDLKQVEFIL